MTHGKFGWIALVFAFLTVAAPGGSMAAEIAGRASVIDGDTIEIHGNRIRLEGIDAPESSQLCQDAAGRRYRCGQSAAMYLDGMIAGKPVSCAVSSHDRYGRAVAECFISVDGKSTSLNAQMVYGGQAIAYRRYSREYVDEEDAARAARLGLWTGTFEEPEAWRRANR